MHDFAEFCLLQYYNTINWKENTYSTILKESDSILNFPIPSNVSSQFSSSSQSSKLHACASLGFPSKSSVGIIATSIPLYIPPGAYIPIFNNFNIYDKIGLGFKKALETVYSPSFFLYSRLSQDRMESLISRRFSRHDMIILSGIQKTDQSHLNIQLIHSRPNISIETLYSTTNEILGASLLTIFSNWSLGLEMFYTFLDKSGGCSIASRYRTSKTTTTFTINPIVGHLHTTFTSRINENLKATSVYGFNINSYESEVGVGVELGNEEGLLKVGCKEQGVNCVFEKRFERGGVEVGFFTGFGKDAKRSVGISFQVY